MARMLQRASQCAPGRHGTDCAQKRYVMSRRDERETVIHLWTLGCHGRKIVLCFCLRRSRIRTVVRKVPEYNNETLVCHSVIAHRRLHSMMRQQYSYGWDLAIRSIVRLCQIQILIVAILLCVLLLKIPVLPGLVHGDCVRIDRIARFATRLQIRLRCLMISDSGVFRNAQFRDNDLDPPPMSGSALRGGEGQTVGVFDYSTCRRARARANQIRRLTVPVRFMLRVFEQSR